MSMKKINHFFVFFVIIILSSVVLSQEPFIWPRSLNNGEKEKVENFVNKAIEQLQKKEDNKNTLYLLDLINVSCLRENYKNFPIPAKISSSDIIDILIYFWKENKEQSLETFYAKTYEILSFLFNNSASILLEYNNTYPKCKIEEFSTLVDILGAAFQNHPDILIIILETLVSSVNSVSQEEYYKIIFRLDEHLSNLNEQQKDILLILGNYIVDYNDDSAAANNIFLFFERITQPNE